MKAKKNKNEKITIKTIKISILKCSNSQKLKWGLSENLKAAKNIYIVWVL